MKKIFILFVSVVFIAAMTACQPGDVPADTVVIPDTVYPTDTADTVDPADTVDFNPPEEIVQPAALAGSYSLTLDVNPSIELTVQEGFVSGAAAYNDDGQEILLSANVMGLGVNAAIDAIIAEIASAGYLNTAETEPYILLTVAGSEENPELCEELQEYTEEALEGARVDSEVKTVAVSGEITDGAAAQGMSAGRYMVLQYIAKEEGISFEEAAELYGTMSMGQLMEQFDDLDEAFDEDGEDDIEDVDDDDQDEDTDDEDGDENEDEADDRDEDENDNEDDGKEDDEDEDEQDEQDNGNDDGEED